MESVELMWWVIVTAGEPRIKRRNALGVPRELVWELAVSLVGTENVKSVFLYFVNG